MAKKSTLKRYIALFRGINVGGRNSVPMQALVRIFQDQGYTGIATYIQSGNVVFNAAGESPAISEKIRKALLTTHGVDASVVLLDAQTLTAAVDGNPYPRDTGKALHFFFLERAADQPNLARLDELKSPSERFQLTTRVFYLYAPDGIGRSKLATSVEKCLGVPVTARNWNTVTKLQQMVNAP